MRARWVCVDGKHELMVCWVHRPHWILSFQRRERLLLSDSVCESPQPDAKPDGDHFRMAWGGGQCRGASPSSGTVGSARGAPKHDRRGTHGTTAPNGCYRARRLGHVGTGRHSVVGRNDNQYVGERKHPQEGSAQALGGQLKATLIQGPGLSQLPSHVDPKETLSIFNDSPFFARPERL